MPVGASIENKNAQKYSLEYAIDLFNKALDLSKRKTDYVIGPNVVKGFEFHFIGEIATSDELDTYTDIFKYLKDAHPETLDLYYKLKNKLESNCFSDSKKGIIKEATAIMNLKSNYKWTDRNDLTTDNKSLNTPPQLGINPLLDSLNNNGE